MKKVALQLTLSFLVVMAVVVPATADVLISEMCDPRLNYQPDRFIEIYNSGSEAVSLNGWALIAIGNTDDIFTWNLSGSIEPGEALVCGDASPVTDFPIHFPAEGWSDNNSTWNGKVGDGAKLRNSSGTLVDVAQVPGTTFENMDLERNENIVTGSSSFNAAEWTGTPVDLPTEGSPGTHHAPPPPQGPEIVGVSTDPAQPQAGQTVLVSAVITDEVAITTVVLDWGLNQSNLDQSINMSLDAGDTYLTDTAIPGQVAGQTVYFRVSATNSDMATTESDIFSYEPPFVLIIQDIQGLTNTSPYEGMEVTTEGVVTADYGNLWVIQDGTGIRSGLWVDGGSAPALGTVVEVQGLVQEVNGNTTLTNAAVGSTSAGSLPAAEVVSTGTANTEDYEGVLVRIEEATCTLINSADGYWYVNNTGGSLRVDDLGVSYEPTFGSVYTLNGPVSDNSTFLGLVPRFGGDIVFVEDTYAPTIETVEAEGPTSILVTFSETVDAVSAGNPDNYSVTGSTVTGAARVSSQPQRVELTVSYLSTGSHTLTVDGVTDLHDNVVENQSVPFDFYGGNIPPGYYDGTEGLVGNELRGELHDIIDYHDSVSYTYIWTAFYSTDPRPDGYVWDMYSDVPDGTPPYLYTFGDDQAGSGQGEGTGYNREHSWPHSWFGSGSPMYTDLFMVVPTDVYVNNRRSNYPFGEVDNATWTSLNGCKVGTCVYPGYSGVVFEPIDEYKGDFARAYFYMSTRYYGEDSSWPGSPMVDGSQLLPWAENMLLEWHFDDPVSQKEIDRNDAVYGIQENRNPYIDRPDFVSRVFGSELSPVQESPVLMTALLNQNVPNPFNPSTTISYELSAEGPVRLDIFDVAGRLVRTLVEEDQNAGRHEQMWNGRNETGQICPAGMYFYRLQSDQDSLTKRMVLVK